LLQVDRVASKNHRGQTGVPADCFRTLNGGLQVLTIGNPQFERWVRLMGDGELIPPA
jgi:hypothetical protein